MSGIGADRLEIDEHPRDVRRSFTLQHFGTAAGLAVFVAAILGFLGEGPFAHESTQGPKGAFTVDFDRFVRTAASTSLQVQLQKGSGPQPVALSQDYLQEFQVGTISPPPVTTTVQGDRTVYTFDVRPGAQVQFEVTPTKIGWYTGQVFTRYGEVSVHQFVYP